MHHANETVLKITLKAQILKSPSEACQHSVSQEKEAMWESATLDPV